MKTLFYSLIFFSLCLSCQHKPGPIDIDSAQLTSYLIKEEQYLTWSSKARIKALGGRPPTEAPPPTFGLDFKEAANKTVVLDVRPEETFAKYNLKMSPTTKARVANVSAALILEAPSEEILEHRLSPEGIHKDTIVIVICDREPWKVAQYLFDFGYQRVLNYRADPATTASCREAP